MSITEQVTDLIEKAIPDAKVTVVGGGGHFEIDVESQAFEGKTIVQKQRLVYSAITPLMAGDSAPVHAVDRLICRMPGE